VPPAQDIGEVQFILHGEDGKEHYGLRLRVGSGS
jgi:hypothetical protein